MKNKVVVALSAIAMISSLSVASAATPATTSFKVKLKVEQGCIISTEGELDFGAHAVLTEAIKEIFPVTFNLACSESLPFAISFSGGANGNSTMTNGVDTIAYTLYSDAAHTVAIEINALYQGVGTGEDIPGIIYGIVAGGQGAKSIGQYEDTVTVIVSY